MNTVIQRSYFKYVIFNITMINTLQFILHIIFCHYCNENDVFAWCKRGDKRVEFSLKQKLTIVLGPDRFREIHPQLEFANQTQLEVQKSLLDPWQQSTDVRSVKKQTACGTALNFEACLWISDSGRTSSSGLGRIFVVCWHTKHKSKPCRGDYVYI